MQSASPRSATNPVPSKSGTVAKASRAVAIGDRFVRATTFETRREAYVVAEMMTRPGYPPHARLLGGTTGDTLLIAVSVLVDPVFWRRLSDAGG